MQSSQQYISCREKVIDRLLGDLRDELMEQVVARFRDALDEAISDGEQAESERSELEDKVTDLEDELSELRIKRDELQARVEELESLLQPSLAL